jgi:hypothetical protein
MAIVPGVLYLGEAHGNGGLPFISGTGYPEYNLQVTRDPRLLAPVPANPNGSPPYPAPFLPFYDGTAGPLYISGISYTDTVVTVTPSPGWTNNEFQGRVLTLFNLYLPFSIAHLGIPRLVTIVSNTANTITVAEWPFAATVSSTLLTPGITYKITTVGTTNWVALGASSSTLGVIFQATGAGAGTGFAKSIPGANTPFRPGRGEFIHYSPIRGGISSNYATGISDGLGSSWQGGGDLGVGSDITWVKAFAQRVFPIATYPSGFHCVKFLGTEKVGIGWVPGGLAFEAFKLELIRVAAAAARQGNTIEWRLAILDLSAIDIALAFQLPVGVNYVTAMAGLLDWLNGPFGLNNTALFEPLVDLRFQLVSHDASLWGTSSAGAAYIVRGIHKDAVLNPANNGKIAIVDMNGAEFSQSNLLHLTPAQNDPSGEGKYYTFAEYARQGNMFADTYLRQLAGTSDVISGGIAVYGFIGDSNAVGFVHPQWAANLASQSLIGTHPNTVVDVGYVYDRSGPVLALYDPLTNANTSGTLNGFSGPELKLISYLATLHPEGFVLVKRAASGATLQEVTQPYTGQQYGRWIKDAPNEHYAEFLTDVRTAFSLCVTQLNKIPDFLGLFVPSLGQNDCTVVGAGARVVAELEQFCTDIRADISTSARASGRQFPIIWGQPLVGSTIGIAEEIAIVRGGLLARASQDPKFIVFEMSDTERARMPDGVHDNPLSAIIRGERMANSLAGVRLN